MLFYKYLDDPRCEGAHMAVGLFLGCSFSSVLVMLDQFGVWSAEWDLMGALSTVNHRNEIFYNNGNHLHLSNVGLTNCNQTHAKQQLKLAF